MKFQFHQFVSCMGYSLLIAIAASFECHARPLDISISRESTSNINIAVQKNSIDKDFEFRTLIPGKTLKLPKEGEKVSLRFGLRITNNSPSEKFFVPNQVDASFLDINQQLMPPLNGYKPPNAACTYLGKSFISKDSFRSSLKPGESVDFFDEAILSRKQGRVTIEYFTSGGLLCTYGDFKVGKYSVFMTYRSMSRKTIDIFVRETDRKNVWIDHIETVPEVIAFVEDT